MMIPAESRGGREIAHSREIARRDPEDAWGWGTAAGRQRFARRAALIAAAAHLGPGKQVLEIGCGTGLFTEKFAQTGAQILAVDISSELLDQARRRDLPEHQVRFWEGRFEDCAPRASFDAIIGSSVLHHLAIEEALIRILELLRPGGWVCFAEPNLLNPQVYLERKFVFLRKLFWYVSFDETAFSRMQLVSLLRRTGFEEIHVVPIDWLHPSTPALLIPVVQWMGDWLERTPVLREFAGSLLIRCRKPMK